MFVCGVICFFLQRSFMGQRSVIPESKCHVLVLYIYNVDLDLVSYKWILEQFVLRSLAVLLFSKVYRRGPKICETAKAETRKSRTLKVI